MCGRTVVQLATLNNAEGTRCQPALLVLCEKILSPRRKHARHGHHYATRGPLRFPNAREPSTPYALNTLDLNDDDLSNCHEERYLPTILLLLSPTHSS